MKENLVARKDTVVLCIYQLRPCSTWLRGGHCLSGCINCNLTTHHHSLLRQ